MSTDTDHEQRAPSNWIDADHRFDADRPGRRGRSALVGVAVATAAIAAVAWAVSVRENGGTVATGAPAATNLPTATLPSTVTTSTGVAPATPSGYAIVTGTDDPVETARRFAVDFVGFVDPILGDFDEGDSRSGEVTIRPNPRASATTTVLLRRLDESDRWSVIGSVAPDIRVDTPETLAVITSPLHVTGAALAFEGHIRVTVRSTSGDDLGDGFVTGGGDVVRPFTGDIPFTAVPGTRGAVLFVQPSAEDGSAVSATVVPVEFGVAVTPRRAAS